jgi:hypothetical protein
MRSTMLVAVLSEMFVWGSAVAGAQTPADPVAKHRAAYKVIARDFARYRHAKADMDTLGLERQSTDGGSLEAYCDGTAIRLLVAEYYGETGDATYRFYFDHDSLFFVFVESRRGQPNGRDPYPPRTRVEHERFYFTADRLIRWLGAKNEARSVATSDAKERGGQLLGDAQRLRAVMPACQPKYAPA